MLGKLVSNSYTYTDKVASLVQEAAYVQTNPSNQEGDAASIPVSHIDGENLVIKSLFTRLHHRMISFLNPLNLSSTHSVFLLPPDVIDMLDVILEGNDGEMEEFGPSLSDDLIIQTFPFSVLVPAALEARNNLSANKSKAKNKMKKY